MPSPLAVLQSGTHIGCTTLFITHGSVPATGNFQRLRGRPPLV